MIRTPTFGRCLAIAIAIAAPIAAQDQPANKPPAADSRLEAMTQRAGTLKMRFADDPERAAPELLKSPILRCNDPTREEVDGAVWLWVDGKRPVAAMCLMRYAIGKWNYEQISLADEALAVSGRPGWNWQPKAAKRHWMAIDEAVPESPRTRQAALRAWPRRLEADEVRRGEKFALRLLERPIFSYADPDHGVTDGAIFALSYGTNPEVLVQIEARQSNGKRSWQVSFARLSAAAIRVRLADKEIWNVDATPVGSYDPREPYYAVNESD